MKTDTVIIGGGLSGLALATRLHQAGVDYVLLEARERLGGRILSREFDGAVFDLGPAWFWPGQPRMASLVDRLQLNVFDQYSTGAIVFEDQLGRVRRGIGLASMQGSCRIDGGLGALITGLARLSPPSHLHLNAKVCSLARNPMGLL